VSIKRERWEEIQQGELAYHQRKDETRILEHNLPYWRALLAALPPEVRFGPDTRVLDLGCGGCGILLALERGRLVGADPLMHDYLEKFPFLRQRADIRWVQATAEEPGIEGPFDVVFCINAFDHVFDPPRVVANIRRLLRPGGSCVLTMNSHNTRLFCGYYRRLYRLIDHHHPHQYTPDDLCRLFGEFESHVVRPIDELWLPHAEAYYREVLRRPVEDPRKWLRGALNPFKWPMAFCKLVLGIPPHAKRAGQRSIFSNYLFVFRR